MSRSWAEFLGDDSAAARAEERRGWFRACASRCRRSREALTSELTSVFDPADDEAWERIEEALIRADVGVPATVEIVRRLEARQPATQAELLGGLEEVVAELVSPAGRGAARARRPPDGRPRRRRERHGQDDDDRQARAPPRGARPLGASSPPRTRSAPRRRSSSRSGPTAPAPTSSAPQRGGDPAAVAFDAIAAAEARGRDVVIVDTAGRLHTQANLMEELAKVRRVIAGRLDGAPHETLLVVDATTGQNGLQQARLFGEAVDVTGVVADEARRHARRAASPSRSPTSSASR